jgi:ribonuclease HI
LGEGQLVISYFTDGSASPNPGPGGFAVIKDGRPWLIGGEPVDSAVSAAQTTNIRMEGLAILAALDDAGDEPCEITTDSEFWINVLTKWAPNWAANGWQKKGGIKNLDIVKPLYNKYNKLYHKLTWTRGHVGTELNELADEWANKARQRHVRDVIKVSTTQRID